MTLRKNKTRLKLKAELALKKKTENRANPDSECIITFFSLKRGIDQLKGKSVLFFKRYNKVK